jgi:hypothetical protein
VRQKVILAVIKIQFFSRIKNQLHDEWRSLSTERRRTLRVECEFLEEEESLNSLQRTEIELDYSHLGVRVALRIYDETRRVLAEVENDNDELDGGLVDTSRINEIRHINEERRQNALEQLRIENKQIDELYEEMDDINERRAAIAIAAELEVEEVDDNADKCRIELKEEIEHKVQEEDDNIQL